MSYKEDMKITDFTRQILEGETIEAKMLSFEGVVFDQAIYDLPKFPGRKGNLEFSDKNIKFPRGHFHEKEKKAIALHSFANHELLAVEMMAAALLIYPHETPEQQRFKKGILSALQDEQKHFNLYQVELNKLGYEFGDFPLNSFFWSYMHKLKTPEQYTALMSLTFEAANLDFAFQYEKIFRELGDESIADALQVVLKDEISHVNFGVHYMNKWRGDKSLVDYYQQQLPWPLSPARAKGKGYRAELRRKAKMDEEFIHFIQNYQDDFTVTNRREWKQ